MLYDFGLGKGRSWVSRTDILQQFKGEEEKTAYTLLYGQDYLGKQWQVDKGPHGRSDLWHYRLLEPGKALVRVARGDHTTLLQTLLKRKFSDYDPNIDWFAFPTAAREHRQLIKAIRESKESSMGCWVHKPAGHGVSTVYTKAMRWKAWHPAARREPSVLWHHPGVNNVDEDKKMKTKVVRHHPTRCESHETHHHQCCWRPPTSATAAKTGICATRPNA